MTPSALTLANTSTWALASILCLAPITSVAQTLEDDDFDADDSAAIAVDAEVADSDWVPQPPPMAPMTEGVEVPQAPPRAPTLVEFQQTLAPYGTWLDVPGLGRVWQPSPSVVGNEFVPYVSNGSWVNVSGQWGFQSQWAWGWAPFHYGRWHLSPQYGWVWWPGYTWAPAWVDWRCNNGYVGWAPRPPPGIQRPFSLSMPGWSFVARHRFGGPSNARYMRYPRYEINRGSGGRGWGWSRSPTWHASTPVRQQKGYQYGGFRGGFHQAAPPPPPPPPQRSAPGGQWNRPPPPQGGGWRGGFNGSGHGGGHRGHH